ncbi:MAG TPA: hypothetical protein VGN88_14235 [Phycisphaerae bacterium]
MRPLNIFQRCIRIWEESHPYNAAQILQIAGRAEVDRLTEAWNDTLFTSGLGIAHVNGRHFCYEKSMPQAVKLVDSGLGLEAYLTGEINSPFGPVQRGKSAVSMPFRPFVHQGEGSYHLGIVYQHWVADSIAMRMLLREWFQRICDPSRATRQPLEIPYGGFWRYFGPRRADWNLVEGALSVPESMSQFANARRIDESSGTERVACTLHRLPDGMVDELREIARRRKIRGAPAATLNDIFLAALARACDLFGAAPRQCGRDLALGSIVDLRASSHENLDNTFGLFLGFTSLVVRAAVLGDRQRLLSHIAAQNAHLKELRAAQVSMLRMATGYLQGRFLSPRKLAAFYRHYMPFSGGLSNVNMNRSWPSRYHPAPLLDYIRVAPTGPMVPLVIALTTLGSRFTFTLTRRESLVDQAHATQLAHTFIEELTAFAKTA